MDTPGFERIAPLLHHPLVLVGLLSTLFFGLARLVITTRLIPTLSPRQGFRVVVRILNYAFVLALIVTILGFGIIAYSYLNHSSPVYTINGHPPDDFFALGILLGKPAASILVRFPDETLVLSDDFLYALRASLNALSFKDSDSVATAMKAAMVRADSASFPTIDVEGFSQLTSLKTRIDSYVASEYGPEAGCIMQLGIHISYLRRQLVQVRSLDSFRARGEVDDAQYQELLHKNLQLIYPQIDFFRMAAASNYFDTTPSVRKSISFVATANLLGMEDRTRVWDELNAIGLEYHMPLGEFRRRVPLLSLATPDSSRPRPGDNRERFQDYEQLIGEAHQLSSHMRPRSHSIDEVTENLQRRVDVKRRADSALAEHVITQEQHQEIVRVLRQVADR